MGVYDTIDTYIYTYAYILFNVGGFARAVALERSFAVGQFGNVEGKCRYLARGRDHGGVFCPLQLDTNRGSTSRSS